MDEECGEYGPWEENTFRSGEKITCYTKTIECHIFKHERGTFTASYDNVWLDGVFDTFEEAERAVLGIGE